MWSACSGAAVAVGRASFLCDDYKAVSEDVACPVVYFTDATLRQVRSTTYYVRMEGFDVVYSQANGFSISRMAVICSDMTERGCAYVELALIVHVEDGMFLVVNMEVGTRTVSSLFLFYFFSVVLLPICTTALPRYVITS